MVRAFKGTRPQRITGYHIILDALREKKTRSGFAEGLTLGSILVEGTAAKVNILAIGAVIVAAMATAEVIDRLSREGFRGKSGPGNDYLAVFVLISGVGGLKTGHDSFGWG